MAQMLRDEDSTKRHLDTARSHVRRSNATTGAQGFATAITPSHDRLLAASQETELRRREEQDREDDLDLRRFDSADLIRTLDGRAKEHDRDNPGAQAHAMVFREGGFGVFLDSRGGASVRSLDELSVRVTSLGEGHALAVFPAQLTAGAEGIRAAERAVEEALRARKLAEADEETAQAVLRKAYEDNYLDAKKALGARCERLFPRFRRKRKKRKPSTGE